MSAPTRAETINQIRKSLSETTLANAGTIEWLLEELAAADEREQQQNEDVRDMQVRLQRVVDANIALKEREQQIRDLYAIGEYEHHSDMLNDILAIIGDKP